MAASGWHYVAPYDEDPEAALQNLRQKVFRSGNYGVWHTPGTIWRTFWSLSLLGKVLFLVGTLCVEIEMVFRWLSRGCRGPHSIEEALRDAAESGTHTILDIHACGMIPEIGVATPLPASRLQQLFGTDQPSHEDFESVDWESLINSIGRWQAVYFPLYEAECPVKLVFVGVSGD
jgi:hypothetical protein